MMRHHILSVGRWVRGIALVTAFVLSVAFGLLLQVGQVISAQEKCARSGKLDNQNGIMICDCTQALNGGSCFCITPGPCSPGSGNDEEGSAQ